MTRIFARNLRDKQVMSSDGITLGVLNNFVIDVRTGTVIDLVIKPDIALDKGKYYVQDEFVLVPFDSVRSIKDYVVVDKNLSRSQGRMEVESRDEVESKVSPQ
ncbi:MAG: PRC-barrel domain-containing protein [ANME-2 cluster archaeon]|jgi:sporulation protein YlmC with PRC-barrel domain|nr:PRC-barrel domain-containing protein [ANME-2 cluster archaeon]